MEKKFVGKFMTRQEILTSFLEEKKETMSENSEINSEAPRTASMNPSLEQSG